MFISGTGVQSSFNLLETDLFKDFMSDVVKPVGYLSGLNVFDIPASHIDRDGMTGLFLQNGGMFPRVYTCVGESETGKTMLVIQLAGSIVDNYDGTFVYIDVEGNTTPERVMSLNGWSLSEFKQKCLYKPSSPPMSVNDVYGLIRKVAHAKSKNKKELTIRTPYINPYTGEFIDILKPTVVVLDSLPYLILSHTADEMISEDDRGEFKEIEKISENIDAMREARDNTNFLKKVKGLLDEWNIILIINNHIIKEASMSIFDKPKKFLPGLKAGERTKGGYEMIYASFGIFRIYQFEQLNEKNPIYGDSIHGSINGLDMVKNKSNISSSSYRYVVDKRRGFCPELSDFEYLFHKKVHIQGSPMSMSLSVLPEVKFTRKNLIDRCDESALLRRALNFTAQVEMMNEYILNDQMGPVDFMEKLGSLPIEWRASIFVGTTFDYPIYRKRRDESVLELYQLAVKGSFYTGFGYEYISPININLLRAIATYGEEYCYSHVNDNIPVGCDGVVI